MKSFFREPVFVDPTGRRSRTLRRAGVVVIAPTSAYLVLLVSSVLGGPTIDTPLLPPAAADRAQADSAVREPAGGEGQVEQVPVPNTVMVTTGPTAASIGVDSTARAADRTAAQWPAVPTAAKPAAGRTVERTASVGVRVKPTRQVTEAASKPGVQAVEKTVTEHPAAKPVVTEPATKPAIKPTAPKPPKAPVVPVPPASVVKPVVKPVVEPVVKPVLAPVAAVVTPVVEPVSRVVRPILAPVVVVVKPILKPVVDPVVELTGGVGGLLGLGK
ncbi:hypothetical protein [Kribbella sp. CA-293567]|uniref:hypothetical protein n=1 Tax=Kribbella sp. CA-293567 TaxID=3002436 RepID=UPI0022DE49D0|nr:hypothetical protein [Kribbella sp. CA-293567]WBQ06025.1 hypothetical protein OX958_04285 [Kribbella sp. CA-293567]